MSRFYSFPHANYGGEGKARVRSSPGSPDTGALKEDPKFSEYFAGRNKLRAEKPPTVGFDPGERFNYKGLDRGGEVLNESYNQHTGEVELLTKVSSQLDSGTRRQTWVPTSDTQMVLKSDKRVTD